MKLTIQTRLLPTPEQAALLRLTMERFNEAATFAAKVGFEAEVFTQFRIHKLAYRAIRERFGLAAQLAVRAIAKAVECFRRDKKTCPVFQPLGAVTYDERILGFKGPDTVSLGTLDGRMILPLIYGKYQAERFDRIKGQCDLVHRDGMWFLYATADVPEKPPARVGDFLGVDLGMTAIATDSDGNRYSGKPVETIRRKHNLQRKRLQRKGTKGAKKKLKRVSGKEARFRKHENHCISKALVQTAEDTGRGIAVEDLNGIRDRLPVWGKDVRNKLSGWSFAQLVGFLSYKAGLAGVPVVKVGPRYTSQTCSSCGHCCRENRKSQAKFLCVSCGHRANADQNAALNLRALAASKTATELVGLRA